MFQSSQEIQQKQQNVGVVDRSDRDNMREENRTKILQNTHRKMKQTQGNSSRKSVYDATNTSTSMIIINNKHGKSSRLWTEKPKHLDSSRVSTIDPDRHTRESNVSSRGRFHTSCNKSNYPKKFEPSLKLNLDFDERPPSLRYGDWLHEAKTSVNQRRHRHCSPGVSDTPVKLPKIKSNQRRMVHKGNNFTEYHMQAWKLLYLRLQKRQCTRYSI